MGCGGSKKKSNVEEQSIIKTNKNKPKKKKQKNTTKKKFIQLEGKDKDNPKEMTDGKRVDTMLQYLSDEDTLLNLSKIKSPNCSQLISMVSDDENLETIIQKK